MKHIPSNADLVSIDVPSQTGETIDQWRARHSDRIEQEENDDRSNRG